MISINRLADIDLRLLRVFKAVADCGGIASAELELNMAMSTISRHIKDLEIRLGLVLCRRGRAGFSLTTEGQEIYIATNQLFAATEAFCNKVHSVHGQFAGDLHVAVFEKSLSNSMCLLPEAIKAFKAAAPDVFIHIHVGSITAIERGVIDGQYHFGITPEHRHSDSLTYSPLFKENMNLYAGREHVWFEDCHTQKTWTDLSEQPIVALGYQSPNMELMHLRGLRRAASASDQEGVLALVLSGEYVGFLPDHYADQFVRTGQIRAVNPRVLKYECQYSCIRRNGKSLSRLCEVFLEALCHTHHIKV
jgi:DNA-binding transcriptional LysR family regulator